MERIKLTLEAKVIEYLQDDCLVASSVTFEFDYRNKAIYIDESIDILIDSVDHTGIHQQQEQHYNIIQVIKREDKDNISMFNENDGSKELLRNNAEVAVDIWLAFAETLYNLEQGLG